LFVAYIKSYITIIRQRIIDHHHHHHVHHFHYHYHHGHHYINATNKKHAVLNGTTQFIIVISLLNHPISHNITDRINHHHHHHHHVHMTIITITTHHHLSSLTPSATIFPIVLIIRSTSAFNCFCCCSASKIHIMRRCEDYSDANCRI